MLLDRRIEGLVVLANWLFVDIDLLADLEKHNIPTAGGRARIEKRQHQLGDRRQQSGAPERRLTICIRWAIVRSRLSRSAPVVGHRTAMARRNVRWRVNGTSNSTALIVDLPESRDPFSSFEDGYKLTENWLRRRRSFTALMALTI